MKHSSAFVESQIVWGTLAARLRLILLLWMIYSSMVGVTSLFERLHSPRISALGITDEVEKLGLKGSKRKKSKKLDEDYAPILKPLQDKDVPKVIQAIRQTSSRKVLLKLLTRIKVRDQRRAGDREVIESVLDHGG